MLDFLSDNFPELFSGVGVLFLVFAAMIIFVAFVFAKNIKSSKKPHIYKYNGHELKILVKMTVVKIYYDDKVIDEMNISVANTAGASFNEILDGVRYRINVGYSGITPKVVVFADNEKLVPIK